MGTVFTSIPTHPLVPPKLDEIAVPQIPGGYAIWGSTGRDDRGHLWFGVASDGIATPSAHLFELDPNGVRLVNRGNVVDQLKAAGRLRKGESQMKIHSKIIPGDDGYLYFASMDERGESASRQKYPTWGGHLWRYKPGETNWEHLLATKEALIAVAGTGRWIYALGYFHHVLYQYDTRSGTVSKTIVGAAGAHISRNFLVDLNGHVYVPRVTETASKDSKSNPTLRATLVEFNTELREQQETLLTDYEPTRDFESHGIVGWTFLANGDLLFATHTGGLWRIHPGKKQAMVTRLGSFHPEGRSYPSMLATFAGKHHACGITRTPKHGYQWVVYDLATRNATAVDFPKQTRTILQRNNLLLYGSNTRDNRGRCWFAGRWIDRGKKRPILLRATLPR